MKYRKHLNLFFLNNQNRIVPMILFFFFFLSNVFGSTFLDIEKPLLSGDFNSFLTHSSSYIRKNPNGIYTEILLQQIDQLKNNFSNYNRMTNLYYPLLKHSTNNVLKFQIHKWLANIYFSKGDVSRAVSVLNKNGYVTNWKVLGPFQKLGPADIQLPLNYEKENFNENIVYSNNFGIVQFRKLRSFSKSKLMSPYLRASFNSGIMYASTYLFIPEDGVYHIYVQTRDPFSLFVNHKKAFLREQEGEKVYLDVKLKKGWNSFILKFFKHSSFSYFRFAIVDKNWKDFNFQSTTKQTQVNKFVESSIFQSISQQGIDEKINGLSQQSSYYFVKSLYALFNSQSDLFYHYINKAIFLAPDNQFYKIYFSSVIINSDEYDNSSRLQKALEYLRAMKNSKFSIVYNLLGLYYAQHHRTKEAIYNLSKATQLNPQSFLFHFDLARFYYTKKWNKEFLESVKKSISLNPDFTRGYNLLIEYYQYKNFDLTKKYYEKIVHDDVFSYDNLRYIKFLTRTGNYGRVLQLVHNLQKYYLFLPSLELKKIKILMNLGKTNEVKEIYNNLLEEFPVVSYILEEGADYYYLQHNQKKGQELLKRACQFAPQNKQLLDKLNIYQAKKLFNLDSYLKYPATSKTIKKMLKSSYQDKEAPAVFINDEEVLSINQNGTFHKLIYQIIKIQNKNGIERWANASIDYYPEMQIIQAQTYTPSGDILDVNNIKHQNAKYILSFQSVSVGSILVLKYLITGQWNRVAHTQYFYSDRKVFGKIEDFTLRQTYSIITPKNLDFVFDQYHFNKDIVIHKSTTKDKNITTFSAKNLKGVKNESHLPSLYDIFPSFYVYSFPKSSEKFVQWYKGLIDFYSIESDEIGEKLFELSHNPNMKNNELNLIKKIYYWINQNIKIDSYVLYSPENPRRVLDEQSASVENKTLLMRQFLKKMNLSSELILIRTVDMPFVKMSHLNPSLFNDVLLKVQYKENSYYLDFSNQYFKFGEYGWDRFNAVGFNLATQKKEIIPEIKTNNLIEFYYDIFLNPVAQSDFPIQVKGRRKLLGSYSIYKEYFKEEDTREMVVNQLENNVFTGIDILDIEFSAMSNNEQYFSYNMTAELKDWLKHNGKKIIVPFLCKKNNLSKNFISKKERKLPLQIITPIHNYQKTILHLSDLKVRSMPENIVIQEKFSDNVTARYFIQYQYSGDKKEIIVESGLSLPQQTILPAEYQKFLKFCQAIDNAEQQEIILEH